MRRGAALAHSTPARPRSAPSPTAREACPGRHACGACCSTNCTSPTPSRRWCPTSRSLPPSLYPHAIAIALAERHSWSASRSPSPGAPARCLQSLNRAIGASVPRFAAALPASTSPSRPRVALRASRVSMKGLLTCRTRSCPRPALHAVTACASWSASTGRLRDSEGRVVDVPTLALSTPRIAAATLAPLLAGEPVENFGVACLSIAAPTPGLAHPRARHALERASLHSRRLRAGVPHAGHDGVSSSCTTTRAVIRRRVLTTPGSPCGCVPRPTCSTSALLDHLIVGDDGRYFSFSEGGHDARPSDATWR